MSALVRELKRRLVDSPDLLGELRFNEPLAAYTSWRVGGPCDLMYLPHDLKDLARFLKQLPEGIRITWLGLGSNTLIRDEGLNGVVIITQGALNQMALVDACMVRAEAGVSSAQLARFTARQAGTGLEFMAGIPGTVGGALAMNAGCYQGEAWQHVISVETINRFGEMNTRPASDFIVSYRHVKRPPGEWFVSGTFRFESGDKTLALETIRNMLEKRNAAQPTGTQNCGSVFTNPKGMFAGRLIEAAGLKGKRIGGAVVSTKHANFIINDNHASAKDIEDLIGHVMEVVHQHANVYLVPEVCMMGRGD